MKVNVTIPVNIDEIKLGTYLEYEKAVKDVTDSNEILKKRVSIIAGINREYIDSISIGDLMEIDATLISVLNQRTMFTNRFTMNGVEYGFIPNLDKMTFGEYVDLDTFLQSSDNLNKVMTVLYRPIIKKKLDAYDILEYTGDEDYNNMLDAPLGIVNSAILFFWNLEKSLLKAIPNYLENQLKKDTTLKQALERNGAGIQASMDLLREKFGELEKLLD